jgi:hypothetical protein
MNLPKTPVDVTGADFLNYATVKKMFGWADNRSIRDAVTAGKLKRVHIGTGKQDFRITKESAVTFRDSILEEAEAAEFFEKTPGQMKAMRQARKRRPVPQVVPEVIINESDVMRDAGNLRSAPPVSCEDFMQERAPAAQTAEHKLGAYYMATGAEKVTAYRALTWQQRNKIIEAQRGSE